MLALGLFVLGFFSGSVLYSALLPRLAKGVDVRALAPDHNPGAANVFKYAGVPVGILALVCDLAKAYVPVRLALRWLPLADPAFALVLCAPVLGHAFSPFAHFRGGKAIAASFGALLALLPRLHGGAAADLLVHIVFHRRHHPPPCGAHHPHLCAGGRRSGPAALLFGAHGRGAHRGGRDLAASPGAARPAARPDPAGPYRVDLAAWQPRRTAHAALASKKFKSGCKSSRFFCASVLQ